MRPDWSAAAAPTCCIDGGAGVSDLLLLVLACAAGTYIWRGLGVAVAGRLDPNGEIFNWLASVALAMVAGLVARMLIEPAGVLAATSFSARLVATACALVVYYVLTRRNLLAGVLTGCVAIVLLERIG